MATLKSAKFHTEDGANILLRTDEGDQVVSTGQLLLHTNFIDWLRASGQIEPYLTIVSAEYSNAEGTAVMARTEEAGRVLVSQDKPDRWLALKKWVAAGGVIAPFVDRDAEARAAREAEAERAAKRQALLDAMIDAGVTPEQVLSMKAS